MTPAGFLSQLGADTDSAFSMAQRAANKIAAPLHYRYKLCFAAFYFAAAGAG
jgi:hypothetical protein